MRLATAESCTGGLIAGCLTEIAGSSAVVDRGYVVYDNRAKAEMLGVREETLTAHGAVSEETAREIDLEVRRIIDDAVGEVREILLSRRAALDALARTLVEKEVIDGTDVRAIIEANCPGPKLVPGTLPIVPVPKETEAPMERSLREGISPG